MTRPSLTAAQTTLLVSVGGAIAASSFLFLAHHAATQSHRYLLVAISMCLCVAGFYLSVTSQADLKNGVQNERWPSDQIEPLRNILDSSLLRFASAAVVLAAIGVLLFTLFNHQKTVYVWPLIILGQTLTQLQQALKPPPPSRSATGWPQPLPLQSEHWGER